MSSMKLFGLREKRKAITTISASVKPFFPGLVKSHFNALAANDVYVGDFTCLPITDHMRTSSAQEVLMMSKG
ncbi:transposase [Corynebacterium glutamicum MT]|nr:transposase [Corynebacterium glutamicum MT]